MKRKPKTVQSLYEKYPRIFKDGAPDPFECRDGWYRILDNLCKGIDGLIKNHPQITVHVSQVKEKFGTLRFYYSFEAIGIPDNQYKSISQKIDQLVDKAERLSGQTCENCGASGKVYGSGWIQTLCHNCYEESRIRYIESFVDYIRQYKNGYFSFN